MELMLKMAKNTFFLLLFGLVSYAAYLWFSFPNSNNTDLKEIVNQAAVDAASIAANKNNSIDSASKEIINPLNSHRSIKIEVPFIVQAPNGDWKEPMYQNGCEEASALMAINWVQGKSSIDAVFAQQEIKNISYYETKAIGTFMDTSVDDTVKFMKGYFKYDLADVKRNITSEDIKTELEQGNILLVPMYGQALGNPHFVEPGPVEHMLVVTGFDLNTDEFITNDPGTKFGKSYKYKVDTFMNAIWAYPTSDKNVEYPGKDLIQRDMIIVRKK